MFLSGLFGLEVIFNAHNELVVSDSLVSRCELTDFLESVVCLQIPRSDQGVASAEIVRLGADQDEPAVPASFFDELDVFLDFEIHDMSDLRRFGRKLDGSHVSVGHDEESVLLQEDLDIGAILAVNGCVNDPYHGIPPKCRELKGHN